QLQHCQNAPVDSQTRKKEHTAHSKYCKKYQHQSVSICNPLFWKSIQIFVVFAVFQKPLPVFAPQGQQPVASRKNQENTAQSIQPIGQRKNIFQDKSYKTTIGRPKESFPFSADSFVKKQKDKKADSQKKTCTFS